MASHRPQPQRGDGGALPGDALYEILLRVPAGYLCRFRAVCQSWRSLLSDPPFVAAHATRHRDDDPLFAVAVAGGSHGEVAEIRLLDASGRVVKRLDAGPSALLRQVRPHLDLVLIRRLALTSVNVRDGRRPLCVLDPATGAATLLPGDGGYCSSYVFGRAASSTGGDGECKVLGLGRSTPQSCNVLTVDNGDGGGGLRRGTWRHCTSTPPVNIDTLHVGTVVAKGVVYHLADNTDCSWKIAAFDLEAEQWRPDLLDGPVAEPSVGYHTSRSLAEVNGRLAAVSSTVSTMDVWLLMGAAGEWRKRCRVLTSSIQRRHGVADAEPMWVLDDGRVALWVCSDFGSRAAAGLWMYDPRARTCTEVAAVDGWLKVGVGVYTGNLLQQPQRAHGK